MVMVEVESADGYGLFGSFELAANETVFSAALGLQRQTNVGPELALATKAMGRLDQSHQKSGADGAEIHPKSFARRGARQRPLAQTVSVDVSYAPYGISIEPVRAAICSPSESRTTCLTR